MLNSSIQPIDGTLSSATTLSQSGPGSNGNEGVLHIHQISSITEVSPSNSCVIYPGQSLGKFYLFAEMQLVYSAALANWAMLYLVECIKMLK